MPSRATTRVLATAGELGDSLAHDLVDAHAVSIAVAFAKPTAWQAVDLRAWSDGDRPLRMVVGTDFQLTDLDVIRGLRGRPNTHCRVFHGLAPHRAPTFHPKLYVLDKGDSVVAYVGSSNLTLGGLSRNLEANVRLEGPPDSPGIHEAISAFEGYFHSEFATELSTEFEARYDELRRMRRQAEARQYQDGASLREQLLVAESLLVAEYRALVANCRWLLVTTPENYAICMRSSTWGRKNERDIRAYAPGDVFFMHVTGRSEVVAMGMFTGEPYHDPAPLWAEMDGKGAFPWRIRFVPLGELRVGVSTKRVLEPLRPAAPRNWFHGFIQASHSLEHRDFEALRWAFERSLRLDRGLDTG